MSEPSNAPPGASPSPKASTAGTGKVRSAARSTPLENEGTPDPMELTGRLRAGAADTALNVFSILREAVDDFQRSDRFFKYKALIIGGWVFLSLFTFIAAFPSTLANSIGARLVTTQVTGTPIYMVVNESDEVWEDVVIVVNDEYQASARKVDPGRELTLGPKQLIGENGALAPSDLQIRSLVVKTSEGNATLLKTKK